MSAPQVFRWDGEAMRPLRPQLADRDFVIGETYRLAEEHERSGVSHRHFFAAVNEAWMNLPAHLAAQFPTSEHLRKYALIKAGYFDGASHVCGSKAEAQRLRAFVAPIDDFSVVDVREATVTVYRAKSQSTKAMGREQFQESKDRVLDVLADMIGVAVADLHKRAEAA